MNIREIARRTGTSYTTVSRALNDSPLIALKTKERIQSVARELRYTIDANARSLATGIRLAIGVLYPYSNLRRVESLYTKELLHSIREHLYVRKFDTIVAGYDTLGEDISEMSRLVREKKVDGLVIIGHEMTRKAVEEIAHSTGNLLLVNPGNNLKDEPYDKIIIDHRHGGELAAQALESIAPEKLMMITQENPQFYNRTAGFLDAVTGRCGEKASSLVRAETVEDGSYETAYAFAQTRIEFFARHRGVFVQTDMSAFGIMNALQDGGLKIPEDIAIVGYDDVEWCQYCRPSLTTIHQPRTDVARLAAEIITRNVLSGEAEHVSHVLRPVLVRRESS